MIGLNIAITRQTRKNSNAPAEFLLINIRCCLEKGSYFSFWVAPLCADQGFSLKFEEIRTYFPDFYETGHSGEFDLEGDLIPRLNSPRFIGY